MFDSGNIIWAAHRFYVCSSISFCFIYSYVRQPKMASSLVNVWAHSNIVIVCVIDRSISKSFLCHQCVVLYTVYVFYVRMAPVRSQHATTRYTLRNSRPTLLPRLPLPIPGTRLSSSSPSLPAVVDPQVYIGNPYVRQHNGWLNKETAGDCKRRWRIVKIRLSFSMFDYLWGRRMFNSFRSV